MISALPSAVSTQSSGAHETTQLSAISSPATFPTQAASGGQSLSHKLPEFLPVASHLELEVDVNRRIVIAKVINDQSGEVIRQIHCEGLGEGALVNHRV